MLHLDLSGVAYNQEEVIAKVLSNALCKWEKEYGSENNTDIPGIRFGFLNFLLGYYAPTQSDSTNTLISLMSMDVESGNPEGFMTRLDALFARTNLVRQVKNRAQHINTVMMIYDQRKSLT